MSACRFAGGLGLAPLLRAIPDFGCGGTFLLDSASVEMIPAVIMEDARACVEQALSRRSDRERNNFPRAPVGSLV
jgi:hypothetical protein